MTLILKNPTSPAKEVYKLVGFTVNNIYYAIDIMCVREVINPIALMAVPSLPSYVKGVADHRDEVVPIIDLRVRFGVERASKTSKTKWIIIKVAGRDIGLEVDRVTEVLSVDFSDKRDQLPATYIEKPWIGNVYQKSDHLIFELNLEAVIAPSKLELDAGTTQG